MSQIIRMHAAGSDHIIYHTSLASPISSGERLERSTRAFAAALDRANKMTMAQLRGPNFPPASGQGTITGTGAPNTATAAPRRTRGALQNCCRCRAAVQVGVPCSADFRAASGPKDCTTFFMLPKTVFRTSIETAESEVYRPRDFKIRAGSATLNSASPHANSSERQRSRRDATESASLLQT